jgi:hypothetical protein
MGGGGEMTSVITQPRHKIKESSRFAQAMSLYPQRMRLRGCSAKANVSSDKIKLKRKILTDQHRLLRN